MDSANDSTTNDNTTIDDLDEVPGDQQEIYKRCVASYDIMLENADAVKDVVDNFQISSAVQINNLTAEDFQFLSNLADPAKNKGVNIWAGYFTRSLAAIGITAGQYTRVVHRLSDMGCIEQIQRGSAGNPSIWMMYKAPTAKDFNSVTGTITNSSKYNLAGGRRAAEASVEISQRINDLQSQINDLNHRISTVEKVVIATTAGTATEFEPEPEPEPEPELDEPSIVPPTITDEELDQISKLEELSMNEYDSEHDDD